MKDKHFNLFRIRAETAVCVSEQCLTSLPLKVQHATITGKGPLNDLQAG